MATIYRANGTTEEVHPKNNRDFSLEELQEIVGGYFELVRPRRLPTKYMVVNEDGHRLNLSFNKIGSEYYGSAEIVGDILICKLTEIH
jgi:hypothetical protein